MSKSEKTKAGEQAASGEQAVVIHPPLTGDPRALESFTQAQPITTATVDEPAPMAASATPAPAVPANAVPEIAPTPGGQRALGLDALRGFLLLAMTFAMTVPFGAFPTWMYHMQNPPPTGAFLEVAGITWRDLMFPGFLFTMSAAIPITNSLRLRKGMPYPAIIFTAIKRFALLSVFALIIGHVNPYWTEDYTKRGNLVAIAGFLVCWLVFTRKAPGWNDRTYRIVRRVGWLAVAVVLFAFPLLYAKEFSLSRRDGIIAAIAFSSLFATGIWLFTRTRPAIRLGIIALFAAAKVGALSGGWVQSVWTATPAAWLYEPWHLELMIIVLAGTLCGDILLQWMKPRDVTAVAVEWSKPRLIAIALVCAAFTPIALVGLFNRNIPVTAGLTILLAIAGAALFIKPVAERDRTLARLYGWAAFWLVLAMILEPFEGGIKKVPQTLSYLTLTTGLSITMLIIALILTDVMRGARKFTEPLVQIGQNPLLAYIAFMLFLNHIAYGAGIGDVFTDLWWQATIRGLIFTLGAALIVIAATRRRLFWRA